MTRSVSDSDDRVGQSDFHRYHLPGRSTRCIECCALFCLPITFHRRLTHFGTHSLCPFFDNYLLAHILSSAIQTSHVTITSLEELDPSSRAQSSAIESPCKEHRSWHCSPPLQERSSRLAHNTSYSALKADRLVSITSMIG